MENNGRALAREMALIRATRAPRNLRYTMNAFEIQECSLMNLRLRDQVLAFLGCNSQSAARRLLNLDGDRAIMTRVVQFHVSACHDRDFWSPRVFQEIGDLARQHNEVLDRLYWTLEAARRALDA